MKKKVVLIVCIILLLALGVVGYLNVKNGKEESSSTSASNNLAADVTINLSDLTSLKTYTLEEYDTFLTDYNAKTLPSVYVTKFLFDGAGVYKTYDLDDFIEEGNDVEVKTYDGKVINITNAGNYEFTGELTGGMIAVNANDVKGNINIILNGVKLDTDSKKVPAIDVYNKDITSTDAKVTIIAKKDTKNYIEGGKLKKVSLIEKNELSTYTSKYSGDNKTNYNAYTNYYGVYTSEEVNKVLFAKITADSEDLQDGDPYYFYKAAGAISSDIDLYFEGEGYLEVTSKNKEGIETKGSLTFAGGTGDYVISSQDDCLNTTTKSSSGTNVHNTLTIDVNSLYAIVSLEADEGDAIDSNGELIINGGTVVAIAKPGQDAGIDSESGIYINGGTVLATGDMYEEVKSSSKQNFMVLSFGSSTSENDIVSLTDESSNAVFSYKTDRAYSNLVYSSNKLVNGTYNLFKNGTITGNNNYGFYTNATLTDGVQLGYRSNSIQGMDGGMPESFNGERTEMPSMSEGERPQMPSGDRPNMQGNMPNNMGGNTTATNKDFVINGISNLFSGVATYSE